VTGLDFSGAMLTPARVKLRHEITSGSVTLLEADAVAGLADIPGNSVDVLVVSNVLYALPNRAAFWAQAARVLRPAGRLVLSNPDKPGFFPAVRQQWRERGVLGFANPRMVEVILLNMLIDAIASIGRYASVLPTRKAGQSGTCSPSSGAYCCPP
jgi:ubiquinone/menaquinone biosynthesis C-methylase UbiE